MAKRRRSLLGARGAIPGSASSAEDADVGADEVTDAAPPVPEPVPAPVPEPAPEPVEAPTVMMTREELPPAPEPVPAPAPVPYAEAPTTVMQVSDARAEEAPVPVADWPSRDRQVAPSEPPMSDPAPPEPDPVAAPPAVPEQPSFQPLSGYQSPGGADAPVAQDLFGEGGFDDFEGAGPPTEEVPSGVMEDVGQPYNTPYSVPEPPPIPGILDRFTPGPAQRTELGARKRKPDYLADTPDGKDRYEPTPAPPKKRAARPAGDDDDAVAEPRGGAPVGIAVVVLGLGLGAIGIGAVVLGIAMIVGNGGGDDGGIDPVGERDVTSGGVEVRDNMQKKPGLIGVEDPPTDGLPPVPAPDVEPIPVPMPPDPAPEAPAPAPQPSKVAPTPTPAPRPTPRPTPVAPAPAPTAAKATLKIRSNRRVLVYVNGQAIGYTPQDYKVSPGTFTVSAMVPGQPNTKQTRDANASAGGTTVPVDFTF